MKGQKQKLGKICIWCIAAIVSIFPLLAIILYLLFVKNQ